ncbi:sigma-70 family RNA polymerase sigma factor [Singulisphaera sp. PoT]|uniref:sigma-70 family RNA polymerase sigma factor n=1 Tax=Singulisphaera sp. PoT TaxID=3411797 RepID=UPI003BF5934A
MRAKQRDRALFRQIQILYNIGAVRDMTDGQLLERFATDGIEVAELAFSALVERHESLVWRTCLAIVRDEHVAEDAFQATFLVLVRKARSLWVRDSLGPWLHQVACRTAAFHRSRLVRRLKNEQRFATQGSARIFDGQPACDPLRDEAVHEELNRLPEKYRRPLLLCDLEGRTHQEAARFLGWPVGTIKSRQAQGRKLLRERLLRRGVGVAVASSFFDAWRKDAVAAIPDRIARNAVDAAMKMATRPVISSIVGCELIWVFEYVSNWMGMVSLRHLVLAAMAIGIATGGATFVGGGSDEPARAGRLVAQVGRGDSPEKEPMGRGSKVEEPAEDPIQRNAQRLATRKAKAAYEIARLNRELAEIALEEFLEVSYPRDLAVAQSHLKLAEAEETRSKDTLDWAEKMFKKGYLSKAQKVAREASNKAAQFAREQAGAKQKVLIEYSLDKNTKALKSDISKALHEETVKEEIWKREQSKVEKLERKS